MLYEYKCDNNQCPQFSQIVEHSHPMTVEPILVCDVCSQTLIRHISSANFILRGGGWSNPEHNRHDTLNNKPRPLSSYKGRRDE